MSGEKRGNSYKPDREPSKNNISKWQLNISLELMSFVFVIGSTERDVLASYTMVVPAHLLDQCTGANSQSELVLPNWFYNWFSLYKVPHAHS